MPVLIAAYFCVATSILALIAFPGLRRSIVTRLASAARPGARHAAQWIQRSALALRAAPDTILGPMRAARGGVHRAGRRFALALLLVAIPPLIVMFHSTGPELLYEEFDDSANRHIETLLAGEQLVPPRPLPPAVFQTREVERIIPELASASRDWIRLDDAFRQRLLLVFRTLRERHGYEPVLLEGYRSPERQARLAALGPHITRAGALMSYHQYGLAADIAFVADGKIVIDENDPWAARGYRLYGEIAESLGLTWGGRWTMRDFGHVELRRPGVLGRPSTKS
ncbi:MAG: M15 family metallopeptidase [Rhodocyclaceae bacterium]|nr:M15 family metallopeptidase [Rhodocyclaceae bacterium]MCP5309295.1 M15 family metallopeptidase [Zoogloeaceae bacterium]